MLPEGHKPDRDISLKPAAILGEFRTIIALPQFFVYAIAGAFSFAGLFVYVTGAPIIFIGNYHLDRTMFGLVFCWPGLRFHRRQPAQYLAVAVVFEPEYLSGRVDRPDHHHRRHSYRHLVRMVRLAVEYRPAALDPPFCGIAYPNAAALALAPFNRNIGSASALLGFVQMVIGAFASTGVGLLHATTNLPIYAVMAASALIGLVILLANQKRLGRQHATARWHQSPLCTLCRTTGSHISSDIGERICARIRGADQLGDRRAPDRDCLSAQPAPLCR